MQSEPYSVSEGSGAGSLQRYVAPALIGRGGGWRIVLTIVLTLLFGIGLIIAIMLAFFGVVGADATLAALTAKPGAPAALPILLGTIVLFGFATIAAIWLMHRRGPATLLGAWRRFHLAPALWGAFVTISVLAVSAVVGAALGFTEITWRAWPYPEVTGLHAIALVAFIVALVPLQSGAEELFFRGYLLQEGARLSPRPLVWAVAPSVLFGLIHYDPDLAGQGGIGPIVFGTFMFGLCAALLTARAADLSLAIGFHTGNNLVALLVFEGPFGLDGPAPLGVAPAQGMSDTAALAMLTVSSAIELIVVYALLAPYARKLGRAAPSAGPSLPEPNESA